MYSDVAEPASSRVFFKAVTRRHLLATATLSAAAAQTLRPRPTLARPLLLGNFADPTILREPDGYYLTHSSFDFHPGLLIWHSPDLRSWTPVTRAVVNQPGSIWAPELIRHGDTCYLYYPAAGENWVITAKSPRGPWSAPQAIGVKHIDPGHVVGPDGKRYIHLSGGNAVEMSPDGLRAATGPKRVYEGWPIPRDWAIECFCLESPKFVVRDGWYHLTSAQGGTLGPSTSHMVVSARSRTPLGPWENSPHNPIIRTWSRDEEWWSKGHGTIFEGSGGLWYCVLHGVMNGFRTLGRPTLIEPVVWTADGWYRVADRWPEGWDEAVKAIAPMSDDFKSSALGIQWQFHGLLEPARFQTGDGRLRMRGQGTHPGESRPLTVLPMHLAYETEVELALRGSAAAGIFLFASPTDYIGYALGPNGALRRFEKGHRRYNRTDEPEWGKSTITLRIVNDRQDVRFYYRDGEAWRILQPSMDVAAAGALRPALAVFGEGEVEFRNFHYRPLIG